MRQNSSNMIATCFPEIQESKKSVSISSLVYTCEIAALTGLVSSYIYIIIKKVTLKLDVKNQQKEKNSPEDTRIIGPLLTHSRVP